MKKPFFLLLLFCFSIGFKAVGQKSGLGKKSIPEKGKKWFCQLAIQDKTLDFFLEEKRQKNKLTTFLLSNGKEKIELKFNRLEGDSLHCPISIFDAELVFPQKIGEDFEGYFLKNKTQKMFFKASSAWEKKMMKSVGNPIKVSGQWRIRFLNDGLKSDSGLLVLDQKQDSLYGTILSETGDYRFLNGRASETEFYLQTFDGGHAYHFDFLADGSTIKGRFLYGPKGFQDLELEKTSNQNLADPFSLTRVKKEESFKWTATDESGKKVESSDPGWKGKAQIIQVMGSWCPNCLDETRFLIEAWKSKPADVEIIALAFERKPDVKLAFERINAVKTRLNVPYPIFWGGMSNKDSARKSFQGLEKIVAFPTTIFVKKDGSILKIHTGFSGPATGMHYEAWKKEFAEILKELSQ
jgi:thiol-disulfide isomerase/thioredoxin